MKRIMLILAFCDVFALCGVLASGEEKAYEPKRYGVRSGIIDYVVSGDEPTYMKLYFDEW